MTEIRRDPSGSFSRSIGVCVQSASGRDLHLDDLDVLLRQLEEMDEAVLRHLVLDQGHDRRGCADRRRNPEQVEVHLVARIVDAGDHLRDAVLLAGELADDDVVLVVARDRDDDAGRPLDACALEDEQLRRVAVDDDVLELVLEPLEPVAALLDQGDLVPEAQQAPRQVRPDLPAARDQDVHQARWGTAQARAASASASIAIEVGQKVRRPWVA